MNIYILATFFIIIFILELIYFKIAEKYNIVDKPNYRSSHTQVTIRGGGIIFSVAIFIGAGYYSLQYPFFLLGLFLISLVSFIDDINPVANKIRIMCHLIAVSLLFFELNIYNLPFYWIGLAFIFVIGTINAVNFMDGINGITGGYSLITILTLFYVNQYVIVFTNSTYLTLSAISLLVFNFFNFRKKAKCFAGDVGSVSIAFIILFFLLQLIITTNNFKYVFVLLIYGLDVVTTIFFRICRGENIFKAHRTHFYQFLANEKKVSHLLVAFFYALAQLLVNYILMVIPQLSILNGITLIFVITIIFILIRWCYEGNERLFNKEANRTNI